MCNLCNSVSRFSRPLPWRQQNNQYGDKTNAGGNKIIVLGDNYGPINGGGNVNNGNIDSTNDCGGKQMISFMAKMMQFFLAMFAMIGLQNQLACDNCGCGCGAGLDFIS